MAISIEDIKKLRAMTGAGLADVKKALTEAEGDFDKAKEILTTDRLYFGIMMVKTGDADGLVSGAGYRC